MDLTTEWEPATETEAEMAAAVRAGDQIGYLRALSGTALVLPVTDAAATGREPLTWATSTAQGTRYVLAFTSAAALPPGARTVVRESPLFDVAYSVSELGCGLAVDPGLPIQSFLTPQAVADLKEWEPEWAPLDAALRAAVDAEDREAYLGALLGAALVLPLPAAADEEPEEEPDGVPVGEADAGSFVAVRTDALVGVPVSRDITDPEFPWWQTRRVDGVPVILAFTSPARMHAELGEREWVEVGFIEVVTAWPDWSCGLRLNAGGANGTELPGEALRRAYEVFMDALREKNRRVEDPR